MGVGREESDVIGHVFSPLFKCCFAACQCVVGSLSAPLYQSQNFACCTGTSGPLHQNQTNPVRISDFKLSTLANSDICASTNNSSCDDNTFPLDATHLSTDYFESFSRSSSTTSDAEEPQRTESLGRLFAFVGVSLLDFIDDSHHNSTPP